MFISGYVYGGFFEVVESDFFFCLMGLIIVGEIGVFGYKLLVLLDLLVGKCVEVGIKVGVYMCIFFGDCLLIDLDVVF